MKVPSRVYDWIFLASLAFIAVWMALKAVGIINSPAWQELLPFAVAIFGAGAFYQKMREMEYDIKGIKRKISHIDSDIGHLRIDAELLKSDASHLKIELSTVKRKLALWTAVSQ